MCVFGQIFLCHMGGHSAVGDRRDDLPYPLGAHVTHGVHPGDVGFRSLVGDDIAGIIQIDLPFEKPCDRLATDADEYGVTGNCLPLSACHIGRLTNLANRKIYDTFNNTTA